MSGRFCPTCGKQGLPRDALKEQLGIDTDGAMEKVIEADNCEHLFGMAEFHPAVIVRVLARKLIEARGLKRDEQADKQAG